MKALLILMIIVLCVVGIFTPFYIPVCNFASGYVVGSLSVVGRKRLKAGLCN